MPETKLERVVLVLGLCAIGVLGFLVVKQEHHDVRASATARISSTPAATTASTTAVETPTQTTPAQLAHLVLTATRGDCWAVVRSRSARGNVIFAGVIRRGSKKRFNAARLWFRLGAAGNVTGQLNGARIVLPLGSPTMLATASGVQVLALR